MLSDLILLHQLTAEIRSYHKQIVHQLQWQSGSVAKALKTDICWLFSHRYNVQNTLADSGLLLTTFDLFRVIQVTLGNRKISTRINS